jgi:formyltetrahydrofolate deformylase
VTSAIIDGRAIAHVLKGDLAREIERLRHDGAAIGLATVQVGGDYSAGAYERRLRRLAEQLDVRFERHALPADTTQAELLGLITELNCCPEVSGILVLRPLPRHIDESLVFQSVNPGKDIEAVHPENAGLLALGVPRYVPSTAASVFHLLDNWLDAAGESRPDFYHRSLIVVVGRSNNVGKPCVSLGYDRQAAVESLDEWTSKAVGLGRHTRRADVLIVATGVPGLIRAEHVSENAVVIDVGINPRTGPDGRSHRGRRRLRVRVRPRPGHYSGTWGRGPGHRRVAHAQHSAGGPVTGRSTDPGRGPLAVRFEPLPAGGFPMSSARHSGQGILAFSCPDAPGIVHAVSGFLLQQECGIVESQQFDDPDTGSFFMRTRFTRADGSPAPVAELRRSFAGIAGQFAMTWRMVEATERQRVLIMVSRYAHCLNELLFRNSIGDLNLDVVAVVSNHPDLGRLADSYGVPFTHVPVTPETKVEAEASLLEVVERERVDLVILARYMQILSDDLCKRLEGRAINIHHSALPSFKGARPYHQAYSRGVKVIGATAQYVTADLDEGPIIEQEFVRVDHSMDAEAITMHGRGAEARALAHAVIWHSENRVLLNGSKTVILR